MSLFLSLIFTFPSTTFTYLWGCCAQTFFFYFSVFVTLLKELFWIRTHNFLCVACTKSAIQIQRRPPPIQGLSVHRFIYLWVLLGNTKGSYLLKIFVCLLIFHGSITGIPMLLDMLLFGVCKAANPGIPFIFPWHWLAVPTRAEIRKVIDVSLPRWIPLSVLAHIKVCLVCE